MNKQLVADIVAMNNYHQTIRALNDRRTYILTAIGDRVVEPTDEILGELAELNIALGDADYVFPEASDE